MADIFISYARADRNKIEKLAAALEAEGYSVWWDRQIVGGDEFSTDIERELNAAKAVIVGWSDSGSKSKWVKDEASIAADAGKMIAVSIDGADPPIGYRQYHCIDLSSWKGNAKETVFAEMARSAKAKVTGEDAPVAAAASVEGRGVSSAGLRFSGLALATGLAIFTIGFFVLQGGGEGGGGKTIEVSRPDAPLVADEHSIAVLPFTDMSAAGDQEYFGDGIAEELLNVLAGVDGLRVVSRTSAFSFKTREATVGEIATALNVGHLLEGSVRKAGDTLRITAQLIDVSTDEHLWSGTYDRALTAESIFAIQDEIARAIVTELRGHLALPSTAPAERTISTEAYDAYLRGRGLIAQRTSETIDEGLAALNRAATLDPDFALVQAALVEAYILANTYANMPNEQTIARAAPHADRALALAPDAAESLAAYGWLLEESENYRGAIDYFERAIAANPNDAETWRRLGLTFRTLDRFDKAKDAFEKAYQLDPLSPIVLANWSIALSNQGELGAAGINARNAARLRPDDVVVRAGVADALWYEADFAGAHEIWKGAEAISGRARRNLAYTYDEIGLPELAAPRANAEIQTVIALRKGDKAEAARAARSFQPILLLWAGNIDRAYEFVKTDIEKRDLLSDEVTLSPSTQYVAAYYSEILSARNDPYAEIFKKRLAAQFKGRAPADFEAPDSLYAGAKWRMINNDVNGALLWLEELIDRGHIWRDIDFDPALDPLREAPEFQALMAKREENADRHRALIEAQLADPDPDWIMP
ncbi:MAG: TIR domain-containing protein [Marinicaulis sp.]|nr:TIR domain-containing protein [Marinicaulis sp.]